MVKSKLTTSLNDTLTAHECPQFEDITGAAPTDLQGPYNWSTTEQGLVVSLYFAGYMLGMFPAGYFADRFVVDFII